MALFSLLTLAGFGLTAIAFVYFMHGIGDYELDENHAPAPWRVWALFWYWIGWQLSKLIERVESWIEARERRPHHYKWMDK